MTDDGTDSGSLDARFDDWYRASAARPLRILERACVERLLHLTFGYYLVQIGLTDQFSEARAASRIRHHVLLSGPSAAPDAGGGPRLLARAEALPFAADSIDALLLPHALDLAADPRAVLREAERVLIPEGRLILLGFNPFSLWGAWSLARRSGGPAPWGVRFINPHRLAGWLAELGFDIEQREYLMYRPPFRFAQGPRGAVLDRFGQRLWPVLGAVYGIRAVKRVSTLTPLMPIRQRRRGLLAGHLVEPSARERGHV